MEIALIGMPQSGKTTLLSALTKGRSEGHGSRSSKDALTAGAVKVPDPRLDTLAEIFQPDRTTPAEITFWDVPASLGSTTNGVRISGQTANLLQKADALLHVVRAFQDPTVPHHRDTIDPYRDADAMEAELIFSDLAILERRRERIDNNLKGARGHDQDLLLRERELVTRIQEALENEVRVRELGLTSDDRDAVSNYNLLSLKPLLVVFNVGEDSLTTQGQAEGTKSEEPHRAGLLTATLCAKLELELTQLSPEDEEEFRRSLGVTDSALDGLIQSCRELLGQVSFFTYVSQEVRAWSVPADTPAAKAAGSIHSDMERGFIRAEVIGYERLTQCGSIADAKRQGLVRLEGRTYSVQDGDVITFLFNV